MRTNTNNKINTSLRFDPVVFNKVKEISPNGNVSAFINQLVNDYLEKREKEELILAYKRAAKNTALNEEMRELEGTIEDGIDKI